MDGVTCAACHVALAAGAKFCHRCGTQVGSTGTRPARTTVPASTLPWAVALVALLSLVALVAGQRYVAMRGQPSVAGQGSRDTGAPPVPGDPSAAAGRPPDISALSPEERADRLFDRIMRLGAAGKVDSIRLFAPMAVAAFGMLAPLNADQRFDLGRIAELSGDAEMEGAQADTILRAAPTHLLGLILAAHAAGLRGDERARRDFERRLLAAEAVERRRDLPEYLRHETDIATALQAARASRPGT
jgi:hypothetical protein